MSTLLMDFGNSRLKWRCHDEVVQAPAVQAIAHEGRPADAIAALAQQWQGGKPEAVCIAQVLGAAHESTINSAIEQAFGLAPRYARSVADCEGLKSAYAEPARLGVDRWLMLLWHWAHSRSAGAVASAGTALTVDAVDASGQHRGGVIAPGLATMIDATLGRTRFAVGTMQAAFLPGLGSDTEACVRQGALHAAAGLLDRLGSQHPGHKWLTGGDAHTLSPHLAPGWQVQDDLVLHGLATWARLYCAA